MNKQTNNVIVSGIAISTILVAAIFLSNNLTSQAVLGQMMDNKTEMGMMDNKTEMGMMDNKTEMGMMEK